MAGSVAPKIVTDGLVLFLDGANPKSVDTENLALNSESINLWGNNAGAVLVTPNAEIAPDGTLTADVLEQTNVNTPPSGASRWVSSINNRTYVGGVTYTLSIWLKKVSGTDPQPHIYLWAQNGFILDSFNMVGTITTEWRRYTRTFTPAATVSSPNSGLNIGWNVNGVANNFKFAAWGFQIETGSSARDYVRTTSTPKLRTRWFDLSKNVNTGLLVGTPSFSSENGGSIIFDGVDDYVLCPKQTTLVNTTQFTMCAWVKRKLSNSLVIICQTQELNNDVSFELWSDGNVYFEVGNGFNSYGFTSNNSTNWQYLSMVFDGTQTGNSNRLKGYVNGILQVLTYTGTIPSSTGTVDNNLIIGAFLQNSNYSNGNISQTLLYNRALSATEVLQNFNATKSRFGL